MSGANARRSGLAALAEYFTPRAAKKVFAMGAVKVTCSRRGQRRHANVFDAATQVVFRRPGHKQLLRSSLPYKGARNESTRVSLKLDVAEPRRDGTTRSLSFLATSVYKSLVFRSVLTSLGMSRV